jgi:hypothetical protein
MADNLQTSSADVMESGSLDLPVPSGPHRAVMGILYFFYFLQNCVRKVAVHLQKVLELISTIVYTGMNPLNP